MQRDPGGADAVAQQEQPSLSDRAETAVIAQAEVPAAPVWPSALLDTAPAPAASAPAESGVTSTTSPGIAMGQVSAYVSTDLVMPIAVYAAKSAGGDYVKSVTFPAFGGLGLMYRFNEYVGAYADLSTGGFSADLAVNTASADDKLAISGKFSRTQFIPALAIFPFGGAFHVSAGVGYRDQKFSVTGAPTNNEWRINSVTAISGAGDEVRGEITWAKTAPYFALGWKTGSWEKPGFLFSFEIGVVYGQATSTLTLSNSLRKKMQLAAQAMGKNLDAEIAAQNDKVGENISQYKYFPQILLGLGYRF